MVERDAALPLDSDDDATGPGRPQPVHRSWANIGLVAAGGAGGTALRYLIGSVVPAWAGVPVATVGINVLGAFLLGVLLERLAAPGVNPQRGLRLRLALGTGALGGFTTYSALATDTAVLALSHPARALGYALVTVVAGAVASLAGIVLARHLRPAAADPAVTP